MSSSLNFNNNNINNHQQQQQQLTNVSKSISINNARANKLAADYKQIILELRAQNFDVIRFATYRTASKLRFIQKKLNLHLIDLWNVIETFRDNNLHTLDLLNEIEAHKLEACIQNMYIELNKRLAYNQHINVESQTQLLTAWLLNLYDKQRLTRVKVISFKVALTTMCAGKLTDKMKYIFNQISDANKNSLVVHKFELYLKELLTLPTSVFEEPSFGYNENLTKSCFDLTSPIRLNDFLNVVLSDAGPACFIWLNVFHRFTLVQSVMHPVTCNVCQRSNFNGFRYKCQKCRKYQLCQDCFWRGRVSNSHQLTHQMKEYTNYKSAAKQFSNSLKKSFFCKPNKQAQQRQQQQQLDQYNQQLNYSRQQQSSMTYDKRGSTSNFQSTIGSKSTIQQEINSINNNDYSTLARQQQLINELNDKNNINNNNNNLSIKLKRISKNDDFVETTPNGGDFNMNSNNSNKPIDATLIIPSSLNQDSSTLSRVNNNLLQSNLKKSSTQPYANTLSMTRGTKLPTNETSLIANFLLSNKTSTISSTNQINQNQDEHSLIANYSSILSDYYKKNPHLSSSPSAAMPPLSLHQAQTSVSSPTHLITPPSSKLQRQQTTTTSGGTTRINKNFLINENPYIFNETVSPSKNHHQSNNKSIIYNNNNNNKTASLSRHLLPSSTAGYAITNSTSINSDTIHQKQQTRPNNNHYNTNTSYTIKQQQQQMSNINLPVNTTRSLSESNFRLNNNILHTQITSNEEINLMPSITNSNNHNEDKLLKEKREIVAKLEQQNKEIIKEIKRLKLQQLSNRSLDLNEQQKKMILKNLKDNSAVINKKLSESLLVDSQPPPPVIVNPHIIAELQTLKQKKGLLENRMHLLESSRDELIGQLSQLDSVLKQNKQQQPTISPSRHKYSTLQSNNSINSKSENMSSMSLNNMLPSSSSATTFVPIVSASMALQIPLTQIQAQQRTGIITNTSNRRSNPIQNGGGGVSTRSWSTPNTPALFEIHTKQHPQSIFTTTSSNNNNNNNNKITASSLPHSSNGSLISLTGSSNNNGSTSNLRNLRNDLLIAADSVTNAMQSLVKELHSENEINFNTSSDDENNNEANLLNVYPLLKDTTNNKSNRCQSACSISLNNDKNNLLIDQLNQMNSNNNNRYSNSASVTPLTYRRRQQEITNGYDEDEEEDEEEDEDEENCLLTESFIDDPNMIEIANNNKALHLQQQQLQIQYQQQQLHLQQQQNQLIANLTNNNNEQVALWRRELEQRLINDENNNNDNNEIDDDDDENNNNQDEDELNDDDKINKLIEKHLDEDK